MFATLYLLVQSRKFWVGTITVFAMAISVLLVTLGKIDVSALVPTITGVGTIGATLIGSIAWEDASKAKAETQAATTIAVAKLASVPPPPVVPGGHILLTARQAVILQNKAHGMSVDTSELLDANAAIATQLTNPVKS